jgi:hypothetical protein
MKTYSRKEVRTAELETLQIRAYQAGTFYRQQLLSDQTDSFLTDEAEEEWYARCASMAIRWDRVLLATMRLLGDSSHWEPYEGEETAASLIAA